MNASIFGLTLFGVMLITLLLFNSMITIDNMLLEAKFPTWGEINLLKLKILSYP